MSKPFTMVFYQVENQQQDFHHDPTDNHNDSESQEQQASTQQHPNAFIISVPIQALTLKLLKQRFPWHIIEKLQKKNRTQFQMLFKINDINKTVDHVNLWLNLTNQDDKVPLYDSHNIVFLKLRPF